MHVKRRVIFAAAVLVVVLVAASAFAVYSFGGSSGGKIRVACVGDSLTQSTEYPYDLWGMLGKEQFDLRNFGAGSTTVNLASETPYMNTTTYADALAFKPEIVIIMLGTNDAQPSLVPYNGTFVADYVKLLRSFQNLSSNPTVYVVLPPPIYDSQGGKMNPQFYADTLIPLIRQAAAQADVPIVDVYSQMLGHPEYSTDGVHINPQGAQVMADTIYAVLPRAA